MRNIHYVIYNIYVDGYKHVRQQQQQKKKIKKKYLFSWCKFNHGNWIDA